jgi:hypothetical protein
MTSASFVFIAGLVYLGLGVLGLIPAFLMPPPADAPGTHFTLLYGFLLGLFPANVALSALHATTGICALFAAGGAAAAKSAARALAVLFGVLALLGGLPLTETFFGYVPLYGNDVWLHGATALLAAYFGWRAPAAAHDRRRAADRRQHMQPIALERRQRYSDRRRGWDGMHPA